MYKTHRGSSGPESLGTACRDAFLTVSWDCWDTPGQLLGSVHQHVSLSFSSAGEDVHLTASLLAAILLMFCRPCTYPSYTSVRRTSVHATHGHTTSPYLNIPGVACFTFSGKIKQSIRIVSFAYLIVLHYQAAWSQKSIKYMKKEIIFILPNLLKDNHHSFLFYFGTGPCASQLSLKFTV